MRRRGSSGKITALILIIIIVGVLIWINHLTKTSMFMTDGEYILYEARKVTISEFKKDCQCIDSSTLINNKKKYKGEPVIYEGKVTSISQNIFGGGAIVRILVDNRLTIIANISDMEYIKASKGDKVDIFGTFKNIKRKDTTYNLEMNAVRIIEK